MTDIIKTYATLTDIADKCSVDLVDVHHTYNNKIYENIGRDIKTKKIRAYNIGLNVPKHSERALNVIIEYATRKMGYTK